MSPKSRGGCGGTGQHQGQGISQDTQGGTAACEAEAEPASKKRRVGSESSRVHQGSSGLLPPGCDAADPQVSESDEDGSEVCSFDESLPSGFWCPPRLKGCNEVMVQTVRDFHVAMLNDHDRNKFYWKALEALPVRGKSVLDIGAGTGILSLMAARHGAKKVQAIEASRDMATVAQANVNSNGLADVVKVVHGLSTSVEIPESERADVIVSETFGSLLLTEGSLHYLADARERLARPGASIIPAGGSQHMMLVMSPWLRAGAGSDALRSLGIDLGQLGMLQDTAKMCKGFSLSSMPDLVAMSERICIFTVDFHTAQTSDLPETHTFTVRALQAGHIDGVIASWEIWADRERRQRLTTHLEDTRNEPWGFARDVHWGPMVQLVEDFDAAEKSDRSTPPAPIVVSAGEELHLTVRYCLPHRDGFQVTLQRAGRDPIVGSASEAGRSVTSDCTPSSSSAAPASTSSVQVKADGDEADSFEDSLPKGLWCPPRLRGRNEALIEIANSWYSVAAKDSGWCDFFRGAMEDLPVKGKRVLNLRAGAGLLTVMAARLGAAAVVAPEALRDMIDLAKSNAVRNDVGDTVRIVRGLSTSIKLKEAQRADVIIHDAFGSQLLSECCLQDIVDARKRLAKPGASIIPAGGAQHVMLVSSPSLRAVTKLQVEGQEDIDLSNLGQLVDTATMCSTTRDRGFCLSSVPDLTEMSERVCVFSLDFRTARTADLPLRRTFVVRALRAGRIDAVVASWELWSDAERHRKLTTHLEDVRNHPWSYARDLRWGQGLQLVEDFDLATGSSCTGSSSPVAPFFVEEGEELRLTVRFAKPSRHVFQVILQRAETSGSTAASAAAA